jgi:ribosomal protein S18 acetylase RimI-like enzyme
MEEKTMNQPYLLGKDCKLYKLSNEILSNCQKFNCGVPDLNDFFSNNALAYEEELMGKTYCWLDKTDDTKIVAMVTLANSGLQIAHLQNNVKRRINKSITYAKRGRSYPAVLIGRLGVNSEFQGSKYRIGSQVMDFIKRWFKSADNKTGCRFVVVDAANNPHTIKYYERNGFKPIFQNIVNEKEFYDIDDSEALRTRMYFFDLL